MLGWQHQRCAERGKLRSRLPKLSPLRCGCRCSITSTRASVASIAACVSTQPCSLMPVPTRATGFSCLFGCQEDNTGSFSHPKAPVHKLCPLNDCPLLCCQHTLVHCSVHPAPVTHYLAHTAPLPHSPQLLACALNQSQLSPIHWLPTVQSYCVTDALATATQSTEPLAH